MLQSKIDNSEMFLDVGADFVRIIIRGDAARIPSTSNSRMNWFNKAPTLRLLNEALNGSGSNAVNLLRRAREMLNRTRVVSMINPDHRKRLNHLIMLWNALPKHNLKLLCNKDERWQVVLICGKATNRMDTHNLTKPVCDWLQHIGLIENDKNVDCWPVRSDEYAQLFGYDNFESFQIILRPIDRLRKTIEQFLYHFCFLEGSIPAPPPTQQELSYANSPNTN